MRVPYEYAIIQAVPRIERGELINVGVVLYSQRLDFLAARIHLHEDRLRALAESPGHIIPGHDPLVMVRYPAPSPALEGIAVRLDVPPRG